MKTILTLPLLFLSFNLIAAPASCIAEAKRFTFHNESIIDHQTNLTWRRCSEGMMWNGKTCIGESTLMTQAEATERVIESGEHWRLPTIDELYSLFTNPCTGEPTRHTLSDIRDMGENSAPYWSSTQVEDIQNFYYYVDLLHGYVDAHSGGFSLAVRLVRESKPI